MRLAARKDTNQTPIVTELRQLGYLVAITHQLGKGYPDILVSGYHHRLKEHLLVWVEIKSSGGKLTPDEEAFFEQWERSPIIIAFCTEDVMEWFCVEKFNAASRS